METDIMRMTMDDFENLPYWTPYSQEEAPEFDSVIIYPTDIRSIHDSGWGNMTFAACNKGHAVCRMGGCSDALHLDGIGNWKRDNLEQNWVIDCTPNGFLRVFCYEPLEVGAAVSSFEIMRRRRVKIG